MRSNEEILQVALARHVVFFEPNAIVHEYHLRISLSLSLYLLENRREDLRLHFIFELDFPYSLARDFPEIIVLVAIGNITGGNFLCCRAEA